MITIKEDTDLIYDIKNYDVILVGTSIKNALDDGFQIKIARSFPCIRKANLNTRYDDKSKLGKILTVDELVPEFPVFVLCFITKGQAGYGPEDRLDYEAVSKCLSIVADKFGDKRIATTIIGASPFDGNGDSDKVMEIITRELSDCKDVTIYDYVQEHIETEDSTNYADMVFARRNGEISREEYEKRMKKYIWERKLGYYTPIPDLNIVQLRKKAKEELEKRLKYIYEEE